MKEEHMSKTTTVLEDEIISASPEIIEALAEEQAEQATETETVVEVKTKPTSTSIRKAAEAQIDEAFEDLTTAYSQSGAGIAAAEASAEEFVLGIAGLRAAKVTRERISKMLGDRAKKQKVEVPFSATGYITIAEVVASLLQLDETSSLGTVTRKRPNEDGKTEKYEAPVIVRVDGFGGVPTGKDEVEIFGIVRAVVSPQGVAFLTSMNIPDTEYGKDAALRIIRDAEDINAAVRELDRRASLLKDAVAKGKRIERAEKNAKKNAKPVTGDSLIRGLADYVTNFSIDIDTLGEEYEAIIIEQSSMDSLKLAIAKLQAIIDTSVLEVATDAA